MSISFARSTRSIQADNMRASQIGIVVTVLLMLTWGLWFIFSKIPRYQTSETARFTKDGLIVADFSSQALAHIRRGQSAFFKFTNADGQSQIIPTIVADLDPATGRVQLIPRVKGKRRAASLRADVGVQIDLQGHLDGKVDVEVDRVSPAVLAMSASGQFIDTATVSRPAK